MNKPSQNIYINWQNDKIGQQPRLLQLSGVNSITGNDERYVLTASSTEQRITSKLTVSGALWAKASLSIGSFEIPPNMWTTNMYRDAFAFFGSMGSYRSSWAWNGYRSNDPDSGDWTILGIGANYGHFSRIEQGDTGIIFGFASGTSGSNNQAAPTQRMIISSSNIFTYRPIYCQPPTGYNYNTDIFSNKHLIFSSSGRFNYNFISFKFKIYG